MKPLGHNLMPWLIVAALVFGAGPASILHAYEPACRMGCADTEFCCCKPRARLAAERVTLQDPPDDRETCPDGCATLATAPQIKPATSAHPGGVVADSNAGTNPASDERFVSDPTRVDVEARAPPQIP